MANSSCDQGGEHRKRMGHRKRFEKRERRKFCTLERLSDCKSPAVIQLATAVVVEVWVDFFFITEAKP